MNVQQILQQMRVHLTEHGMRARGADKTDFQFPDTRDLYFRTGSAYKEVTIVPVIGEKSIAAIRIVSEEQAVEAKHTIDRIIANWRETA